MSELSTPQTQVEKYREYLAEDPANRVILAADIRTVDQITRIDKRVIERAGIVKIGHKLHNSASWPAAMRLFHNHRARGMFIDARYSENPDQTEQNVQWLKDSLIRTSTDGPTKMVSVDVVKASEEALMRAVMVRGAFLIIGETIQPSMPDEECRRKFRVPSKEAVRLFSQIAAQNDLQGVSASPREMDVIADDPDCSSLIRIATGIREHGDSNNDQHRTETAYTAIANGAEMIVVGRSVLSLPYDEQLDKLESIIESVDRALGL